MAGSLNKVILIGNLGADPEVREMGDGTKMAKFSIATTERYKNREGDRIANTEWHNIVLWRGIAEVAEKYLKKGDSVCVEGKLKTRSWEDENGVKKYATDIQGDSMTMLGSRRDNDPSQMGYQPPEGKKTISNSNNSETTDAVHSTDSNLNNHDSTTTDNAIDDLPFSSEA